MRLPADQERAELKTVLASEMFRRAPNLSRILAYVCQKYFAGDAANIKEYNIAVDALGRGPGFDPNEDTIVRVEASRLRKRLREYYATEGAGNAIRLQLPKSGYVPQFVPRQALAEHDAEPEEEIPGQLSEAAVEPPVEPAPRKGRARRWFWLAAAAGLGAALIAAIIFEGAPRVERAADADPAAAAAPVPTITDGTTEGQVRILCGFTGSRFVDGMGQVWSGDRFFTGGNVDEVRGEDILGVLDPTMYRTSRRGDFRYDIPLKPGVYDLRLMFVETLYGKGNRVLTGEASRVFHVSINGVRRLSSLDILADAGAANVPADRVFKDISPAQDGFLHLEFTSALGRATLSGIEILPGTPGRMRPVRIVAGGRSYYDRAARFWGADRYFIGGRPLTKPTVVHGTTDPELYSNERWGHFSYSIPVPTPGRYKATLRFAETNFGPNNPGKTGVGSRVFNVFCNGVALLQNFDILQETGVENKALDKVFHGLTPNAQGRLVFSFVPVQEYPTIRAIEIVDDAL